MDTCLGVIVLPVFNEHETWQKIVEDVLQIIETDIVILVDDGSSPPLQYIHPKVQLITNERNMGYGYALWQGIKVGISIEAEYIITLDTDGQHRAKDMQKIISKMLNSSADLVIGSRYLRGSLVLGETPEKNRKTNSVLKAILSELFSGRVTDVFSGFRGYKKGFFDGFVPTELGWGFGIETLVYALKNNKKISEIPIPRIYKDNPRIHQAPIDRLPNSLEFYSRVVWRLLGDIE